MKQRSRKSASIITEKEISVQGITGSVIVSTSQVEEIGAELYRTSEGQ